MKKALVLILAVLGILCFSSMALAEGLAVSVDYSSMNMVNTEEQEQGFTALTVGGEYEAGSFLIGGSYLFVLSYDPAPPAGMELSDNFLLAYGGYKVLNAESYSLAITGGYSLWNEEVTMNDVEISEGVYGDVSTTLKISSLGLGIKGAINSGPINISALLLYGISNKAEIDVVISGYGLSTTLDNVSVLSCELKGTYQFTDSLGVFINYRWTDYSLKDEDVGIDMKATIDGFGLGVEYRF